MVKWVVEVCLALENEIASDRDLLGCVVLRKTWIQGVVSFSTKLRSMYEVALQLLRYMSSVHDVFAKC